MWNYFFFYIFFTGVSPSYSNYHRVLFDDWKSTYNKQYSSLEEEDQRFDKWMTNLELVKEHNVQHALKQKTYSLAMNHLADLNVTEAHDLLSGLLHKRRKLPYPIRPYSVSYLGLLNVPESVLPKHVDWREHGMVAPVTEQGTCNSCYAFSTTGALEAQVKRKTGKLTRLSQQNLIDCGKSFGDNGCHGGLMDKAFRFLIKQEGIASYASYPYEEKEGPCRYTKDKRAAIPAAYVDIKKGDEKMMKEAVATVGPISVAMDGRYMGFYLYSGGVYYHEKCYKKKKKMTHALLIVGYGTTDDNMDYWIVRNTWGTNWGMDGYGRIARNANNMCGIATEPSFPLIH